MFDGLSELTDVKYEDIKVEIKSLFTNTFNLEEYVQSFLHSLTILVQIFFLTSESPQVYSISFYSFGISIISFKLLTIITKFIQTKLAELFSKYFNEKKFYEMGDVFKRTIVVNEVIGLVLYFPLKLLIQLLFNDYIISKIPVSLSEQDQTDYHKFAKDKLNEYLFYNFFAYIFIIENRLRLNVLSTFQSKGIIYSNSVIKFAINVLFCFVYRLNHKSSYFVTGICLANLASEAFSTVYLLAMQHFKNPYPEAWSQFSLQIFTGTSFTTVLRNVGVWNFIQFLILELYDEIFLIFYAITNVKKNNFNKIENFNFFLAMVLFKNLFFRFNQKDKEELITFYHTLVENNSNDMYNKLSYEYDSATQKNKNEDWMKYLKTKIIGTFCVNFIIGVVYFVFYICGGFKLLEITHKNLLAVIFFSLNSVVTQVALTVLRILECLVKRYTLIIVLIGLGISVGAYIIVWLFIKGSFSITVLVIYFTFYLIFFRFYPQVKNIDIKIADVEMLTTDKSSSI